MRKHLKRHSIVGSALRVRLFRRNRGGRDRCKATWIAWVCSRLRGGFEKFTAGKTVRDIQYYWKRWHLLTEANFRSEIDRFVRCGIFHRGWRRTRARNWIGIINWLNLELSSRYQRRYWKYYIIELITIRHYGTWNTRLSKKGDRKYNKKG